MTVEECFIRLMNEEVPKDKAPWHEWACLKAYLLDGPLQDCKETYSELFRSTPRELDTAPKWLIVLACMWKGAEAGHRRTGRIFSGIDKQSLALLAKLDEIALQSNKSLRSHIRTGNGDILG